MRLIGSLLTCAGVVVGMARIYVGVHWPSDILAAAVLGFAVDVLVSLGESRLGARARCLIRHFPRAFVAAPDERTSPDGANTMNRFVLKFSQWWLQPSAREPPARAGRAQADRWIGEMMQPVMHVAHVGGRRPHRPRVRKGRDATHVLQRRREATRRVWIGPASG